MVRARSAGGIKQSCQERPDEHLCPLRCLPRLLCPCLRHLEAPGSELPHWAFLPAETQEHPCLGTVELPSPDPCPPGGTGAVCPPNKMESCAARGQAVASLVGFLGPNGWEGMVPFGCF